MAGIQKPENIKRDEALREHILAGRDTKEFAADYGVSRQFIHWCVARIGFRKYFLTRDEWNDVLRRRHHVAKLRG